MFPDSDITAKGNQADAILIEKFEAHIRSETFPCVGGKSALGRGTMTCLVVGDIRCPRDDRVIHSALKAFVSVYRRNPAPFQTFIVLFNKSLDLDECAFERAMWSRLQALETIDAQSGFRYDPRVSPDVDHPEFSLSFAEEAFFVVALHPEASRPARRFDVPALVFNVHDQFEQLRVQGKYETLRASIIERDVRFHGSANPMLTRHGERSEANQYSGRAVGEDWECPFRRVHEERKHAARL